MEAVCAVLIVVFILQPLSRWLETFIDWQIVNPATNHLGWYRASVQNWTVSWLWPAAWIIAWTMRGDMLRSWLLLLLLALLAMGLPETCLWEIGVYTEEERWVIGLSSWYEALAKHTVVAAMAVVAARAPRLLVPALLLSSLSIFI